MNSLLLLMPTFLLSVKCEKTCPGDNSDDDGREKNKYSQISRTWSSFLNSYESGAKAFKATGSIPYEDVIGKDLSQFKDGISLKHLDESRQADSHSVTYQGIRGKLYRSKDCLFPARCQGVEHFLKKVVSSGDAGDFEIVLNFHDWPQISKFFHNRPLPTFSFSKTDEYFDIYFPAWTFWAGGPAVVHHPSGLGRWDLMREKLLKSSGKYPWKEKNDAAFFRGSRTSRERDSLVLLSRRNPELVDAKYTKNQAWKSVEDTLGEEPAEEVRLEDHCKYKYLINFRGVAASFRYKHLFLCGSTVLQVGSQWKEFFYDSLVPWYHYVPVSENSEEALEDLMNFLRHFPEISKKIAANGRDFIENNLKMEDIESYWKTLIKSYASLLSFEPTLRDGFLEIR